MLHLEEKTNPTLEYMIDMVANNTGQTNYRDEIEEDLAKAHMSYIEDKSKLLRYKMRRENMSTTEKIAHLDSLQTVTASLQAIDLLLAEGNYADALERCDSLLPQFEFATRVKREQDTMYEWIEVVTDNTSLENLSTADQNKLRDLAVDYYYTTAGKKASAVLNHYYHEDHFIPAYYGVGSSSVRAMHNKTEQTEIHLLKAFPNPTDGLLQLWLQLGQRNITDEMLSILDAQGRVIETLQAKDGTQQFVIDTRQYASGQYHVILAHGNVELERISFNVVH